MDYGQGTAGLGLIPEIDPSCLVSSWYQNNNQKKRQDDSKKAPGPEAAFGAGVEDAAEGEDYDPGYHNMNVSESSYELAAFHTKVTSEKL